MDAKGFFYELGRALYHIDGVYEVFAKETGVASPALLWTLYALNDGREHTQREICTSWDLPKSTVNTVITELRSLGYAELTPIKGKRREMTVTLTESGKAYAEDLLQEVYKREAAAFQALNGADLQVVAVLNKIAALLKREDQYEQ